MSGLNGAQIWQLTNEIYSYYLNHNKPTTVGLIWEIEPTNPSYLYAYLGNPYSTDSLTIAFGTKPSSGQINGCFKAFEESALKHKVATQYGYQYKRDLIVDQVFLNDCDFFATVDLINKSVFVHHSDIPGVHIGTHFYTDILQTIKQVASPTTTTYAHCGNANTTVNLPAGHSASDSLVYSHKAESVESVPAKKCDCGAWKMGVKDDEDAHDRWCAVWQNRRNPNV